MITLSSDFGWPYPAAMKGVILQSTDARLVDVTHEFPRQDVRAAAFWLRELLPSFPPATHLVVVDPGVGTDRAALVVRAGGHALVGPDNGVLVPAARRLASSGAAMESDIDVFRVAVQTDQATTADDRYTELDSSDWPPAPASSTFHGRDVFAPTAAHVHERGVSTLEDDPALEPVSTPVDLTFPTPSIDEDGVIGTVLVVDTFGNAITNVPGSLIDSSSEPSITVDGEEVPVRQSYAKVEPDQQLLTVGSHGNVELAVNRGRGDRAFEVEVGDSVELTW